MRTRICENRSIIIWNITWRRRQSEVPKNVMCWRRYWCAPDRRCSAWISTLIYAPPATHRRPCRCRASATLLVFVLCNRMITWSSLHWRNHCWLCLDNVYRPQAILARPASPSSAQRRCALCSWQRRYRSSTRSLRGNICWRIRFLLANVTDIVEHPRDSTS